jgi:hypothetical protein
MSVRLKASAVELGHHAAHLHQDALGTYVARDTPGAHAHGIYNANRHRRTGRRQRRAHRLHNYGGRRKPEHDQSPLRRGGSEISGRAQFHQRRTDPISGALRDAAVGIRQCRRLLPAVVVSIVRRPVARWYGRTARRVASTRRRWRRGSVRPSRSGRRTRTHQKKQRCRDKHDRRSSPAGPLDKDSHPDH